jgi:hypothetical protein
MPDRTYSEEEVAELFKRAAELQSERDTLGSTGRAGLSLAELEAIAADAGLDPGLLRAAASELERSPRAHKRTPRTTSSEIVTERHLSGGLDDEAREDIVAELRHRFDTSSAMDWGMGSYGKSTVQTIGRSLEWQYTNPWYGTQTRVLIQPRGDGVRIRVVRSNPYSGTATGWAPWYGPLFAVMAAIVGGSISGSLPLGAVLGLITLLAMTPFFTWMSRKSRERHQQEIEQIADDIAAHVRSHTPTSVVTRAQEPVTDAASTLEIPGSEFEEEGDATRRSERRIKQR